MLCGCGKNSPDIGEEGVIFNNLSGSDINIECKNNTYSGEISFTPENIGSIELTGPGELKGTTFSWENGSTKISKGGLSCESDKNFLPPNSFILCIFNVLKSLRSPENISKSFKNTDFYTVQGTCDSGNFEVDLDDEGFIKEIRIPEKEIKVNILN